MDNLVDCQVKRAESGNEVVTAKPVIVLLGNPGTGKTKVVKNLAN